MGLTGEKGDVGLTGEKGDVGLTGEKGDVGLTGEKGDVGLTGEKGDVGLTGEKGEKGEMGKTGKKGEQGLIGDFSGIIKIGSLQNTINSTICQIDNISLLFEIITDNITNTIITGFNCLTPLVNGRYIMIYNNSNLTLTLNDSTISGEKEYGLSLRLNTTNELLCNSIATFIYCNNKWLLLSIA